MSCHDEVTEYQSRDVGSILVSGRTPGKGCGNPVLLPGESTLTEEPGGLQSIESHRVGHN